MPPKRKQLQGQRKDQSTSTASKVQSSAKVKVATKKPPSTVKGGPGHAGTSKARVDVTKKGISNVTKKKEGQPQATGDSSKGLKKVTWTRNDEMARRIQTAYRGYRCRKMLLNLKKKKIEYDELMDKLQHEAYLKLYKLQLEQEEEERKRNEEERRKQQAHTKRIQRMLEAAFDGEISEIKKLLSEVSTLYSGEQVIFLQQHKLIECTDPNSNTPLSEAAAGGDPGTIRFLLDKGAEPNCKGQHGRTPLYRAAFGGHLEAAKVLLELGADPRIYADDGAIPQQVSANQSLVELFEQWDITITERMLKQLEDKRAEKMKIERKFQADEESKVQAQLDKAEAEYVSRQKQLSKAYEELNKRINEHDEYGHSKGEVTLPAVHDAEDVLEKAKLHAEEARKKLQKVKLELRIMRKNSLNADPDVDEEKVDVTINIRELDDVLMKDVGNKIAESGKWPLLIDPGEQAATFLRYRDTNYLNVCNPRHMEPETIRMAILGAIRYGKCAVLDFMDIEDMWHVVESKFDCIQKNLLTDLMSKVLLKEEKYLTLVRSSDSEEYSPKMFIGARVHNFKFVILTQLLDLPKDLLERCYVIKIHALPK